MTPYVVAAAMTHRRLMLVAALAALPALAGCMDAAGASVDQARAAAGVPPAEISAKSAAATADKLAAEWRADARLWTVHALEWAGSPPPSETSSGPDPELANGKAPAWGFEYVAADGRLSFVVHADRRVTDREEETAEGDHAEEYAEAGRAPEWRIDSDDAMKRLARDDGWRAMTADMQASWVAEGLGFDDDEDENASEETASTRLVWAFVVMDNEGDGVVGLVDATSGAVIGVHAWTMPDWEGWGHWGGWGYGGGWGWSGSNATHRAEHEGELTALQPSASFDFPVDEAGQLVTLHLSTQGALAGVDVTITGPDGADVALERRGGSSAGPARMDDYAAVAGAPGTYTLTLSIGLPDAYVRYVATLVVGEDGAFAAWPSR